MTESTVKGIVYRAFTAGTSSLVGDKYIISDERIIVFDNGIVYASFRKATERKIWRSLEEYINHRYNDGMIKVIGFAHCYYDEPVTQAEMLIHLCNLHLAYFGSEMLEIIWAIQQLFEVATLTEAKATV